MPSITTPIPSENCTTEFLNVQHGGFTKIPIEAKQLASMPLKAWIRLAVKRTIILLGDHAIHPFNGAKRHNGSLLLITTVAQEISL